MYGESIIYKKYENRCSNGEKYVVVVLVEHISALNHCLRLNIESFDT